MEILGIDIGGSALKGAPVDVDKGALTAERYRVEMPKRSVPEAVGDCVANLAAHFEWKGPIGCTFPGIVKKGVTLSAANVDLAWVDYPAQKMFSRKTGSRVVVLNDADAAGIAEIEFGAGKGERGVVIMLTFGTGLGSAVFINGQLVPNTELGHLELNGKDVEKRTAARVKTEKGLSWKQWAARVNDYFALLDFLFSPDLLIIGGGISRHNDKFLRYLKSSARIVPAKFFNDAGIIGAALAAREHS